MDVHVVAQDREIPYFIGLVSRIFGPIPVLHVGWVHRHRQQQSVGIHHNMPFAAFHLLAHVVPSRPPFSVVFTDWL